MDQDFNSGDPFDYWNDASIQKENREVSGLDIMLYPFLVLLIWPFLRSNLGLLSM